MTSTEGRALRMTMGSLGTRTPQDVGRIIGHLVGPGGTFLEVARIPADDFWTSGCQWLLSGHISMGQAKQVEEPDTQQTWMSEDTWVPLVTRIARSPGMDGNATFEVRFSSEAKLPGALGEFLASVLSCDAQTAKDNTTACASGLVRLCWGRWGETLTTPTSRWLVDGMRWTDLRSRVLEPAVTMLRKFFGFCLSLSYETEDRGGKAVRVVIQVGDAPPWIPSLRHACLNEPEGDSGITPMRYETRQKLIRKLHAFVGNGVDPVRSMEIISTLVPIQGKEPYDEFGSAREMTRRMSSGMSLHHVLRPYIGRVPAWVAFGRNVFSRRDLEDARFLVDFMCLWEDSEETEHVALGVAILLLAWGMARGMTQAQVASQLVPMAMADAKDVPNGPREARQVGHFLAFLCAWMDGNHAGKADPRGVGVTDELLAQIQMIRKHEVGDFCRKLDEVGRMVVSGNYLAARFTRPW